MKRLSYLLTSILWAATAQAIPGRAVPNAYIGFPFVDPTGPVSQTGLSSATTGVAFGFTTSQNETINNVKVYLGANTGTPSAPKVMLTTTTSGGDPNCGTMASGACPSATQTLSPTTPTQNAVNQFTGFSTALTAGTYYWIVFGNATATPASNFYTVQRFKMHDNGKSDGAVLLGKASGYNFSFKSTTDGTTWSSGGANPINTLGIRIEFASGRFLGLMFTGAAQDTTNTVYAARAYGVQFTTPSTWPSIKAGRACMHISKSGTTPSSGMRMRLYSSASPSLITDGTSIVVPASSMTDNPGWYCAIFGTTAPTLAPNTVYTLTTETGDGVAGSAANDYRFYSLTIENDANSKAQLPFGGLKRAYYNGSTWATDDTQVVPFMIQLDDAGEFVTTGGGLKGQNSVSGGAQ